MSFKGNLTVTQTNCILRVTFQQPLTDRERATYEEDLPRRVGEVIEVRTWWSTGDEVTFDLAGGVAGYDYAQQKDLLTRLNAALGEIQDKVSR